MQPDTALQETLDLERYVPALLSLLSNKLSAAASRECRAAFGLGVTDWRVIAQIAVRPGSSAARVCLCTGLDKAAVSRSFAVLALRGLVLLRPRGRDREAVLSPAGQELHARLLVQALARQGRLLAGFSEHETLTLRRLLRRLTDNLEAADAALPAAEGATIAPAAPGDCPRTDGDQDDA